MQFEGIVVPVDRRSGLRLYLRRSVATVDAQLGAGHVAGSVGEEESDGAHEVLGLTHLALRDEGDPLLGELGVFVEDLLSAIGKNWLAAFVGKGVSG